MVLIKKKIEDLKLVVSKYVVERDNGLLVCAFHAESVNATFINLAITIYKRF